MATVVVLGEGSEGIFSSLKEVLSYHFEHGVIEEGVGGDGPPSTSRVRLLALNDTEGLLELRPHIVVVTKNGESLCDGRYKAQKSAVIVDGDDPNGRRAGAMLGGRIISCGRRLCNTVTLSSSSDDGLCIYLQRELPGVYGERVTEQEIAIKGVGSKSEYDVMALCTVLLLLGVGGREISSDGF